MNRIAIVLGIVAAGCGGADEPACLATWNARDADGDGVIDFTRTWTYDEQGRMLSDRQEPADGEPSEVRWSYADDGDWTEITSTLSLQVIRQRREGGHLVEEASDDDGDGRTDRTTIQTWERGRLARRETFGADGLLTTETTLLYDGDDPIEEHFTNVASVPPLQWDQVWTYEGRGREIEYSDSYGPDGSGLFEGSRRFTTWAGGDIAGRAWDHDDDGDIDQLSAWEWTGRAAYVLHDRDGDGDGGFSTASHVEYNRQDFPVYEAYEVEIGSLLSNLSWWEYDCR